MAKNNIAVLKIEIDKKIYNEHKKFVKSQNQLLRGYNNMIFLRAVENEIKENSKK